jgi:hypothetical protein
MNRFCICLLGLTLLFPLTVMADAQEGEPPMEEPAPVAAQSPDGLPGHPVPIQGNQHVNKGQPHEPYISTPPTSGPHWNLPAEAPVPWGMYASPVPDEGQVHKLEHGGVMIQYNCADCPELVAQLEDFFARYVPMHRLILYPSSAKILVAPYYDMPQRIALTAWGRIDSFDEYDEDRITRFVDAWRDKGPEQTP